MSQKLRLAWLASVVLLACQAQAQTEEGRPTQSTIERGVPADRTRTTQSPMSKTVTPQSFAKQAATIGQAEIELGQLALQKTQDSGVRSYAQRMVKDHQAAAAKLEEIAARDDLELPQGLDAEHQALKEKLATLNGPTFDREYSKAMVKGHDMAVALFESASQAPQMTPALKEFAAATLPTLKEHLDMAHSLHEKKGA
jgi:putative membrane protein